MIIIVKTIMVKQFFYKINENNYKLYLKEKKLLSLLLKENMT